MSILTWFKKTTEGDTAAPLEFAEGEEEFQGLNIKDALDAHNRWTGRLQSMLNGRSNEQIEVSEVAVDHKCALGKWIHNHGRDHFGALDEYKELKRIHAEFHLTAGEVLNNVKNGNDEKAEYGLKAIRHKSGEVQLALIRLYSSVQA